MMPRRLCEVVKTPQNIQKSMNKIPNVILSEVNTAINAKVDLSVIYESEGYTA